MLIKCPKCGEDLIEYGTKCPNCGFFTDGKVKLVNYPLPEEAYWAKRYLRQRLSSIITLIAIALVSTILCAVFIALCNNDLESLENGIYGTETGIKPKWLVLAIVFGFIALVFIFLAVASPATIKTKLYEVDGYHVVTYTGSFTCSLIIEDKVVESKSLSFSHPTYIDGKLPNGIEVYAKFYMAITELQTKPFNN